MSGPRTARRRRRRENEPRTKVIKLKLSQDELDELEAACARHRRARAAFAADAVMAAARGQLQNGPGGLDDELRAALVDLMQARTQARRIGINLDQAVARLNATGQPAADLPAAAAAATRAVERLEAVATAVRRRLP